MPSTAKQGTFFQAGNERKHLPTLEINLPNKPFGKTDIPITSSPVPKASTKVHFAERLHAPGPAKTVGSCENRQNLRSMVHQTMLKRNANASKHKQT